MFGWGPPLENAVQNGGTAEVTFSEDFSGVAPSSSIAPDVNWYGVSYYPSSADRIYSRANTLFDGSLMLYGNFGYAYYRNLRVVFAGIDHGEIVVWHEPILDGFRGSSSNSPAIAFSTNRLPRDLLICIDHGPRVTKRSILYFSADYQDVEDQRPGAQNGQIQISGLIGTVQLSQINNLDCMDDIRMAAAEFGVLGASSAGLEVIRQYEIDERENRPTVRSFVDSITFRDGVISINVAVAIHSNLRCVGLGQIGIEAGQFPDRIENVDIWSRTTVTRSLQSTCHDANAIYPEESMADGDIVHFNAPATNFGQFLAVCFNTLDPGSGRNTISVEWFRIDAAQEIAEKITSPTPFQTIDSVFCHNSEKWPRP